MGLGYNTKVLYPRPITLARTYLQFHGPYMSNKNIKVFRLDA